MKNLTKLLDSIEHECQTDHFVERQYPGVFKVFQRTERHAGSLRSLVLSKTQTDTTGLRSLADLLRHF